MYMRIENPRVVAAIIDCLNLPVSRKCEAAIISGGDIIFLMDAFTSDTEICRFPIWTDFEIRWWGPDFHVMHPHDIGHWEIDCTTGKSKWVCCYNKEGKIKYGRYYEPSMD